MAVNQFVFQAGGQAWLQEGIPGPGGACCLPSVVSIISPASGKEERVQQGQVPFHVCFFLPLLFIYFCLFVCVP